MTVPPLAREMAAFWIGAGREKWFAKNAAFDESLRRRFEDAHHEAARGAYADWVRTAEGALALILLTDQAPRNLYRGSAHAFATDGLARQAADAAIAQGHDQAFDPGLRCFFYLPFEHSEAPEDQARSMALFTALGDADYLKYAALHADIIARFGRFPHRNLCLGRESTAEEIAFLRDGGFAG